MRLCGITASIATPWSFFLSPRPRRKVKNRAIHDPTIKDSGTQPAFRPLFTPQSTHRALNRLRKNSGPDRKDVPVRQAQGRLSGAKARRILNHLRPD